MSYEVYKIMHLIGIFMVMISLGGVTTYAINGGDKESNRFRKALGITHGVGLLIVLVAGFGLLARLKIGWPGWVFVKLLIWVVFGVFSTVAYRLGAKGQGLWYVLIVIGALAAYLAIVKPF